MTFVKLVIEGDPIPKKRVRCRCINGHGAAYDPQVKNDMLDLKAQFLELREKAPPESDMHLLAIHSTFNVDLNFYLPIAKSTPVFKKNMKLWGLVKCNEKPDFDNLAKFYLDCANGILWPDDRMIVFSRIHKVRYSKNPRTEMIIMPKKELTLNERELTVFQTFSPDEMKQLMQESGKIFNYLRDNERFFQDDENVSDITFISAATLLLTNFAEAFSDKLRKISKLKAA